MNRLNGWQRIGIVVSVLWAIGGGLWGNNIGIHEGDYATHALGRCLDEPGSDWKACEDVFNKDWPEAIKYHWYYAAFVGLVPIPIVWLMAYGILMLIRWIRKGFNPPPGK